MKAEFKGTPLKAITLIVIGIADHLEAEIEGKTPEELKNTFQLTEDVNSIAQEKTF